MKELGNRRIYIVYMNDICREEEFYLFDDFNLCITAGSKMVFYTILISLFVWRTTI